ncbi:MAG: oligosaccharide flippase family protein [Deltaproteobacteria bacterium]|nr:oligosaccharide flippase family protein [Deltaproteobacteria bacterium]
MSSVRKFFVHYSHFLTGSALIQMLGLVSFPIITRVLSVEQYGILGLVTTTMFVMLCFAKAGLSDGIIRFYKQYSESPDKLTEFSSTIVVRGIILSSGVALLFVLIFPLASGLINIDPQYNKYFMIMAGYLLIRPLNIIVLNILRVAERTIMYNVVNLGAKVLSIALSLLLLIYVVKDFYGYFVGLVLAELIVLVVLFYWFTSRHKIKLNAVSGPLALNLMKFGAPLIISELSYLLLTYVDRYMIMAYMGEGALGIYSVGSNLASYVNDLIMFSLSYAVIPIYIGIYEKEGREKTEAFLSKCLHYLLIAVMAVFAGYAATIEDLLAVLASEKYLVAAGFSPIILLGCFFLGMNSILRAGLYLRKDTISILAIMISSLVLNVILNVFMIPTYGVTGAAISQLISCAFASLLTITLSFRHIFVRVELKSVLFYAALSTLMYLAVFRISTPFAPLTLLVKFSVGTAIISAGVLYMEKEVLNAFKRMLPSRRGA